MKPYVAHHRNLAGVARPIFTDDALRQLFQHSQGVPRRVSTLALEALGVAYLQEKELLHASKIHETRFTQCGLNRVK